MTGRSVVIGVARLAAHHIHGYSLMGHRSGIIRDALETLAALAFFRGSTGGSMIRTLVTSQTQLTPANKPFWLVY